MWPCFAHVLLGRSQQQRVSGVVRLLQHHRARRQVAAQNTPKTQQNQTENATKIKLQ